MDIQKIERKWAVRTPQVYSISRVQKHDIKLEQSSKQFGFDSNKGSIEPNILVAFWFGKKT